MISTHGLLFIEPAQPVSPVPVVDRITRQLCAAFRKARRSDYAYCGIHECSCGAQSSCCDYHLPSGDLTNSLCVHYTAHHRPEIPPHQLAKIAAFASGEADPNDEELQGPQLVLARVRSRVEASLGRERLRTWTAWGLDILALSRGLQGGQLPSMRGLAPARQDAESLLTILCSVEPDALALIERVVQEERGNLRAWAAAALRVPGWQRDVWLAPLLALLRRPDGDPMSRRCVAMNLRLLGPAAGAAVPTLIELAKAATGDFLYNLGLALNDVGQIREVVLAPETVPLLVEVAAGDQYAAGLRIQAARLLGCTGLAVAIAVPVLLDLALRDGKQRELAAAVLCGTLGQQEGYLGEPGVREWSRVGLPLLLRALQDPEEAVRGRATQLLGRLGAEAKDAVPLLQQLAEHPGLRTPVEEALLRITSPDTAEQEIAQRRTADKARAQVVVPGIDPAKPRHAQFFLFTCPFCGHGEEVGLWYTSKTCPQCRRHIRMVRQAGASAEVRYRETGPPPEPPPPTSAAPSRRWWQFWK